MGNAILLEIFNIKLTINNYGEIIDLWTNDQKRSRELKELFDKYSNWIAGKENSKYDTTEYIYKIGCQKELLFIQAPTNEMDALPLKSISRHFDFYKGMTKESTDKIANFDYYNLKDFLNVKKELKYKSSNVFRGKTSERQIKLSIDKQVYKLDATVLINNKDIGEVIEINKGTEFIYLPKDSNIEFLALRTKKGKIIHETLKLLSDSRINNPWEELTYKNLSEVLNNW